MSVAVNAQTAPETFVPLSATFLLTIVAATVVPPATVGVPISTAHSCQWKFPSLVPKVLFTVITPADVVGYVASIGWKERWVAPAAATRSVWPTEAAVASSP